MLKKHKFFFLTLIIWTLWVTHWAWILPYNMAPDECLHFKTAKFFQEEKRLPVAGKDAITIVKEENCRGTTYIEMPFLNYVIAAVFINFKNIAGIERDYLATRMSSVFFGIIFVSLFYLFLKKIFKNNNFLVYSTLVSTIFIPQVTYIFAYVNQEAYSLASSVFLILVSFIFWQISLKKLEKKYFLLLGFSVAVHLFSKPNFYLLFLVPLMILVFKFWQEKYFPIKNLLVSAILVFLLSGWFFIRNWILYKDLIGLKTFQEFYQKNFVTRTFSQAGWNFYDMLFKSKWLEETLSSFYGRFGYMTIEIDPTMQWIFRGFLFLGLVGLLKKLSEIKKVKLFWGNYLPYTIFSFLIPINIFLSLWNSLYFDFQNQGRYLFPILIPLMVLVNKGIFGLVKNEESQKNVAIAIITGSILLNFWSFLYLPKL
jgi:4-amino-4-deoxy-L-arabinose transferase-like glycosyltransferase